MVKEEHREPELDEVSGPEEVFVAPGARLVGRVIMGRGVSIWYNAVLRGDHDAIVIGDECNIQDGAVIHADPGEPVTLGERVSVGHAAVVHAAHVENDVIVGIGSVVLNGAHIGHHSIIGAGALVPPGREVPPHSLVLGAPAKVRGELSEAHLELIRETAAGYLETAARYRAAGFNQWKGGEG